MGYTFRTQEGATVQCRYIRSGIGPLPPQLAVAIDAMLHAYTGMTALDPKDCEVASFLASCSALIASVGLVYSVCAPQIGDAPEGAPCEP